MKHVRSPFLGLLIALADLLFVACGHSPVVRELTPEVVEIDTSHLSELGEYQRLVRLETTKGILLGSVERIEIDPRTDDLLVGDFRSSQQLYRFDSEGRFLMSYGHESIDRSPYENLHDFALLDDGRVLLFAGNRCLIFTTDGEFLDQIFLEFVPVEAVTLGDRIYVRGRSFGRKRLQESVFVYDSRMKLRDSFHPYDPRQDVLPFVPRRSLTGGGGLIYVSELFDFRVSAYDAGGNLVARYDFPSHNDEIAPLWRRKASELSSEDRTALHEGVHRARMIHGFDHGLFLFEANVGRKIFRSCLLAEDGRALFTYPNLRLIGGDGSESYLSLTALVGSFGEGLIGISDDPRKIAGNSQHHPHLLSGLEYKSTENPVVLFFKLASKA